MIWFDLKIFLCKLLIWDWCHSDDCHGVSLHDVLFQFCQWKMTLSRVSFFFKYRTLLHWCFIFFFPTTPVILKQFGLEYSWSSSWLSNESTCSWRDGTFSNWISEICYLNDSWLSMIETAFWVALSSFERDFIKCLMLVSLCNNRYN